MNLPETPAFLKKLLNLPETPEITLAFRLHYRLDLVLELTASPIRVKNHKTLFLLSYCPSLKLRFYLIKFSVKISKIKTTLQSL